MAEKKISQLTAKGATVADTDLLVVSESAGGGSYTTKSITGANVKALVTDANLTTSDITTNNVSTTKHGFAPKLPGNTTTFLRGDGTYATPAGGGLTEFTEAENTATPNATVPVNSLTPVTATTNADFAIVPKGSGSILAAIPDNTVTGGNKRGQYAVDWQLLRNGAGRVASGNRSVILGGYNNGSVADYSITGGEGNYVDGTHSVSFGSSNSVSGIKSIAIGESNTVNSDRSSAFGGSNNIASGRNNATAAGGSNSIGGSGNYQTALGYFNTVSNNVSVGIGYFNTSSGAASVTLGEENVSSGTNASSLGRGNTSSATSSVAIGDGNTANANYSNAQGRQSHVFGIIGRQVYASGQESTAGDSQASKFVLRERTTGNTATTLTTDSGAASTTNQVILSNQSAYRFKGTIVGKQSGSVNAAVWDVDGFIVRGANAAATTLNVSNVTLVQNTPAWGTPTLAADTTNGGLQIQVTGAATTNIQWTATIETTEVIYA